MTTLAEAIGAQPCAVVWNQYPDGRWHPHEALLFSGDARMFDYSKAFDALLEPYGNCGYASEFFRREGESLFVCAHGSLDKQKLYIAESLRVFDVDGRPTTIEALGYERDMGLALWQQEIQSVMEVNGTCYCSRCEDFFPEEDDQVCDHLWFCYDRSEWIGDREDHRQCRRWNPCRGCHWENRARRRQWFMKVHISDCAYRYGTSRPIRASRSQG